MGNKDNYLSSPYDVSGSRTKNRFRIEMLWGLSQAIKILYSRSDFCVIFDVQSDVEIHYDDDNMEFFQIKTLKDKLVTKSFLLGYKDGSNSVLGKLYKLWIIGAIDRSTSKIALVSNRPLIINRSRIYDISGTYSFEDMCDKDKKTISDSLKKEFNLDVSDLTNIFYFHSDINLESPEVEIKGQLVDFYNNKLNSEPKHPNALYNHITNEIQRVACVESLFVDYNDILKHKGITGQNLVKIIQLYNDDSDTLFKKTSDIINEEFKLDIFKQRQLKTELPTIIEIEKNTILLNIVGDIIKIIEQKSDNGIQYQLRDLIDAIIDLFKDKFPIEYSDSQKLITVIYSVAKYMEVAK